MNGAFEPGVLIAYIISCRPHRRVSLNPVIGERLSCKDLLRYQKLRVFIFPMTGTSPSLLSLLFLFSHIHVTLSTDSPFNGPCFSAQQEFPAAHIISCSQPPGAVVCLKPISVLPSTDKYAQFMAKLMFVFFLPSLIDPFPFLQFKVVPTSKHKVKPYFKNTLRVSFYIKLNRCFLNIFTDYLFFIIWVYI